MTDRENVEEPGTSLQVDEIVTALRQSTRVLREKINLQRALLQSLDLDEAAGGFLSDMQEALCRMEEVVMAQEVLRDALLSGATTLLGAMAQELGLRAIGDVTDMGFTRDAFAEARRLHRDPDTDFAPYETTWPGLDRALYAQHLAETGVSFAGGLQCDLGTVEETLAAAWENMPLDDRSTMREDIDQDFLPPRLH